MKSNYSRSLLILAIAAMAFPAFAGEHKPDPKPAPAPTTTAVAGAAAVAASHSSSRSSSRSSSSSHATGGNANATGGNAAGGQGGAGGLGGAGGTATQTQTATGGQATNNGNAQSVSFSTPRQLAAAPDAIAPNVYPSASCYHGKSGGVSFGNSAFGAGLSGGKDALDEACDIRETARSFASIGNYEAANTLLCSTPAAMKYLPDGCGKAKPPADPVPQVLVVPTGLSSQEVKERDKKIIEAITGK